MSNPEATSTGFKTETKLLIECYKVVEAENIYQLETEVNQLLEKGWSLYGNMLFCFSAGRNHDCYHQALTKKVYREMQVADSTDSSDQL